MGMLRIGIVVLGLLLPPYYAAAVDDAAPVAGKTPSFTPQSVAARSTKEPQPETATGVKRAAFAQVQASRDVRHIADWVVDSADNRGLPFVIIDKTDAQVFVFDAAGRIQGATPALLGSARGDHTVPGIGDREFSNMPPESRTTPAGRFVAALGRSSARGEDVVWVDYDSAVSLHRVVTNNPKERRLERLATPTPLDNRISYGCINVPKRFYETIVSPAFTGTNGIVYILPETRPAREVFGSYDVEERARRQFAVQVPPNAGIAEASPSEQ
jgi:hypothetical protein